MDKPQASSTQLDEVIELERALWRAAIARRFDFVATQFADDYAGVYAPGGRMTKSEVLGTAGDLHVHFAQMDDARAAEIAPGVVLVTYTLHARGSYRGESFPTCHLSSALWCRREGAWKCVHYHETPHKDAP